MALLTEIEEFIGLLLNAQHVSCNEYLPTFG